VAGGVAFESQPPHASVVHVQAPVLYTKKGTPRKKAPKNDILGAMPNGALWSKRLKKASQYWQEFQHGLNLEKPLRSLEDGGSDWRSNRMIQAVTGKRSTALRKDWSQRAAIYNWILYKIEDCGMDEELAIQEVQAIFEKHMSSKNHHKLGEISVELWGMLKGVGGVTRYGRV
jgi:hypothetical protein